MYCAPKTGPPNEVSKGITGMRPVAARDDGGFSALMPLGNVRQGGIVPPRSVVAPESALGSVPTVALSSAQVVVVVVAGELDCHCSSNSFGVRYPKAEWMRLTL
jgi:hypothetical protein